MPDEPTIGELRRRVDDMRSETRQSFEQLGKRLDRMPTTELLSTHLQMQAQQVDSVRGELKRVEKDLREDLVRVEKDANDRANRIEGQLDAFKTKLEAGRRWQIGTALAVASVLIGLGGFILTAARL